MKKLRLKRLERQTIVITGASSGIGLATARLAVEGGARVFLVSRNERALARAVERLERTGGEAAYAVADVGSERDLQRVVKKVRRAFGGFDTWVNNAGASIYGPLTDIPLEDQRRLFDVNYWGIVHGSLAAVPWLAEHGGALVNVGSVLSDAAVPLQGAYVAAKHAVRGFTDTLRMELEAMGAPVSVSLVKPASVDTPLFEHARNYLPHAPRPLPPVYAPEVVAEAILHCATHPTRDIYAGGGAKAMAELSEHATRLADRAFERKGFRQQQYRARSPGRKDNLFEPSKDGAERGAWDGPVHESSAWAMGARTHALPLLAMVGLGAAVVAAGLRAVRGRDAGAGGPGWEGASRRAGAPARPAGRARAPGRRGATVPDSAEGDLHVP